jgi:hypothetical protein
MAPHADAYGHGFTISDVGMWNKTVAKRLRRQKTRAKPRMSTVSDQVVAALELTSPAGYASRRLKQISVPSETGEGKVFEEWVGEAKAGNRSSMIAAKVSAFS